MKHFTNLRIINCGLWIQYVVDKITNNYFTNFTLPTTLQGRLKKLLNRPCKVVVNSYKEMLRHV